MPTWPRRCPGCIPDPFNPCRNIALATPNYGYEKRQRELAKKQKKEEKARQKAARKTGDGAHPGDEPQEDGGTGSNGAPGGEGGSAD